MRNVAFSERYQSTAKIFAEAGSALFDGYDHTAGVAVVMKVMDGEPDPVRRLAFTREAKLLETLDHPAYPRLLANHSDAARPFLVLDAVAGQPFARWAAEHRPRATTARQLLIELSSALGALHRSGHVHGELSPACLWVRGQAGRTSVSLLSLGRATPTDDALQAIPRPPPAPDGFLAPELFRNRGEPSIATDLYGIGAIVYRYLTGKAPVDIGVSDDRSAATARILETEVDLGPLPRVLRPILGRLLTKDPKQRYGSTDELRKAAEEAALGAQTAGITPGSRVGDYVVHSVLGEGGFGVTVLARDETLQRDVALKFLHRGDADDLLSEARAMARVTHPNVATVYGYGMHEGSAYLVMEYLPGEPLSRVLEVAAEPFGTADLVTILEATAMGVEAIHGAGLVHGDLKPANIVVGPAFRIGVTDFGLVQAVDHFETRGHRIEGTPAYLAPERIRGRVNAKLAHRIDVYALGILAYELITGSPPFNDQDRSLILQRHLHAPITAPSALAGRLETLDPVVLRALQKDPRRRTPDVATFRRELREALAAEDELAEGLRILLVDPDREQRSKIAALVERLVPGGRVSQAAIGSAALRRAARKRPDLLLLELDLPDMNGVELLAELRGALEDPPPVVVVTANGSASDWPLLRGLGARAFMPKPIDEEIFQLVLDKLLDR